VYKSVGTHDVRTGDIENINKIKPSIFFIVYP
jgi:hypothetical protein